MRFPTAAVAAIASTGVLAAPLEKRAKITDAQILNYALTLEHLEDTFYRQGLANFTQEEFAKAGFNAAFYANLKEIASDERNHVAFLTGALGAGAVSECTYNFPYTNPKSFVALASILEGVGVSAYLGAAASIASKAYLTVAGSILTVEARHSAFIRNSISEVPFASPYDTPLDFDEVYTLAAPFITGCPANNTGLLPATLKAFPSLSLLNRDGKTVYLITAAGTTLPKNTYAAWASVTGPIFTEVKLSTNSQSAWTTIPEGAPPTAGVAGQSYVVLVKGNKTVTDDNILAGPAIIEV